VVVELKVTSFAPASGVAGTAVEIEGTGFSEVAAENTVRFGGVTAELLAASATRLRARVPEAAESGSITVQVGGRTATSAGVFQVIVPNPAPVLLTMAPRFVAVGEAATVLSLGGSGFVPLTTAVLDGENLATQFVSATLVRATVPEAKLAVAGERGVYVVSPGPGGGTSAVEVFEVRNPAPVVTGFSPSRLELGTTPAELEVRGLGFGPMTTATLNGAPLAVVLIDRATLLVMVPSSARAAAGTLTVTVTNPGPGGGQAFGLVDVVQPAPLTSSLTPAEVPADGAVRQVQVRGSGFVPESRVRVEGTAVPTTFVDGALLVAELDATYTQQGQVYAITVSTPLPGGGSSAPLYWTVRNPLPSLSSLTPTTVPVNAAPATLTLTGTGFNAGSTVLVNGSALPTTQRGANTLEGALPTLAAAGAYTVAVRNPEPGGGTSNELVLQAEAFTQPVITALSPQPAPAMQAFTLTVQGAGFTCGATPSRIGLGALEIPAASCTATTLTAAVAPLPVGTVAVKVRNPSQSLESTSVAFSVVTPNPTPVLTSMTPTSAVVAGAPPVLTLTGSGFLSSSVVTVDGAARTTTYVNGGSLESALTFADLASAGARQVRVVSPGPGGGASAALAFSVLAPNPLPVITALQPESAVAGAGALELRVLGSNFLPGSTVKVGGLARSVTYLSTTELAVAVPATDTDTARTLEIEVTNPAPGGGPGAAFAWPVLTPNPLPVLTSVSPTALAAGSGAQALTLSGEAFLASSVGFVDGTARATTFVSATQLRLELSAADTATAGSWTVDVRTPAPGGGTSSALTVQVLNPAPQITSITPDSVLVGSGAFTLSVTGSGFVAGSVVRVGGSPRTTSFVNSTQLAAELLAGDVASGGTPAVTVSNAGPGGGTSDPVSLVVNNPAPVLSSLSPTEANAGAGAFTLVVTGAGFVAGSTVEWAGSPRATTFVSPTRLEVAILGTDVTNAGTRAVTVKTGPPGGGTSGALNFTVRVPVPVLDALSPCGRVAGAGAFTLTATGSGFVAGATVDFDGETYTPTLVTSTMLTVEIPALATASSPADAAVEVLVTNPEPGGGASEPMVFGLASARRTFTTDVQPLLSARCAECHSWTRPMLLSGTAFCDGSIPYVLSCGPLTTQSYLIGTITGVGVCGSQMPPSGPALTSEEIQTIVDWVAQGAPN
jgi:mono/diheme cytochrome c family protein